MSRKQPIDLVIAKGKRHLTKAEIEKRKNEEVKVNKDDIVAPEYLNLKEIQRFNFYVEEMTFSNIVANLDVSFLARHVQNEIEFERISKELSNLDPFTSDYEIIFKYYDKLYRNLIVSSNALGLNATSRCKIQVNNRDSDTKENKFNKFMG